MQKCNRKNIKRLKIICIEKKWNNLEIGIKNMNSRYHVFISKPFKFQNSERVNVLILSPPSLSVHAIWTNAK